MSAPLNPPVPPVDPNAPPTTWVALVYNLSVSKTAQQVMNVLILLGMAWLSQHLGVKVDTAAAIGQQNAEVIQKVSEVQEVNHADVKAIAVKQDEVKKALDAKNK
jgi:hypothetical protein